MKLKQLQIENYRNIESACFVPDDGLTVIAGLNGQGKTNLIESIFLLTGSKSFRTSKDIDLIKQDKELSRIIGKTLSDKKENDISIVVEGGKEGRKGRYAKINGVDYGRATNIAGVFTAVVFEPNHLSLVKSGPDGRRKFIDAALCQLYPSYITVLRRFTRALTQKNALLRRYYSIYDADTQLDVFDIELAQSGEEITKRRKEWVENIAKKAQMFYKELSSDAEKLNVNFLAGADLGTLQDVLYHARERDIKTGYSTKGPQREDFEVSLNDKKARIFGSQGQQRSCVLALKLAEAELAKDISGQHPVLLLDDVLSELDEGRKEYLLSKVEGKQSFISCCDASVFEKTAGKLVYIHNGKLKEN